MFNPAYFYNSNSSLIKKDLVAAYKLSDGTDSYINAYNGTVGSAVIFSTSNAVDGSAGQFNDNVNSRITIADNDAFSFTDGTNDKPFSIKANIYYVQLGAINPIFSRYTGSNNNTSEYLFYLRSNGKLALLLFKYSLPIIREISKFLHIKGEIVPLLSKILLLPVSTFQRKST